VNIRFCALIALLVLPVVTGTIMSSNEGIEVREVDTFSSSGKLGQLDGWVSTGNDLNDCYAIGEEENNYFLQASVKNSGTIIAKEINYRLEEYPIIAWRWRALQLPVGGDERYKCSGDSVAGIYIIFPSLFKPERFKSSWGLKLPVPDALKPECIKYVWSSSLPRGTVTESPYASKTKIVVLQNGTSPLNQWVTEEVNVYEDYKKLFGKEPDEVRAVGILTDADDTSSEAMADYDDIFIKQSPSTSLRRGS
jgi:hypothetical protein